MAPFRVLDLPGELRNQIWRKSVVSDCLINISYALPPLTQANQQLRNETRGIFFAENSFRLNLGLYNPSKRTNLYRLFCWLAAIGPEARTQINHIDIMFYWDVFTLDCAPGPLDIPRERFTFQMIAGHPLTRGLRLSAVTFEILDRDHKSSFRRRVARLGEKLQSDYALGETVRKGAVRRRFLALLAREVGPRALAQRPWLRWTCKRIIDSQADMRLIQDHVRKTIKALREDPRGFVVARWQRVEAVRQALEDKVTPPIAMVIVVGVLVAMLLAPLVFCT